MIMPGDHVFDIGAHIGTFAIPMAQRVGTTGMVVAVEAQSDNFALLIGNIAANGLDNRIRAIKKVVSRGNSHYVQMIDDSNSGATHFMQSDDGDQSCTLDEIASQTFQPDVIKLDVEGLEATVLLASDMVRAYRPVLYTEVSVPHMKRYGINIAEFDLFLRGLGYRLFRNAGERNAAHDNYLPVELNELSEGGAFFDVLAIAADSPRLRRIYQ
jgi:FkbM family methyltransferase